MALGGQPGSDIQFQWKEVKSASRFSTKVWNITRFAAQHLDEDREPLAEPAYRDVDRWILSRCASVADEVATHMDDYRFDAALRELREFVWHDLADDYLELIKGRLYEGRPGERDAARQALFTAVSASLRMLSPFAPFLTEEAWQALPGTEGSVHAAAWPDPTPGPGPGVESADGTETGALIADVASTVRGWKSEAGMALNADLAKIEVYPEQAPESAVDTYDLSEAVNAPVHVREDEPSVELVPVGIEPDHATIGPEFRERAGDVVAALEAMDPAAVRDGKRIDGEIEVDIGSDGSQETAVVPGDAVEVVEEHRAESGEEVVVLEGERATVLVYP
jgi:valyl-tRNA synthetase